MHAHLHLELFVSSRRDTPASTLEIDLSTPIVVQPPAADAVEYVTTAESTQQVRDTVKIEVFGVRKIEDPFGRSPATSGLICTVSTKMTSHWFRHESACPVNASLRILAMSGEQYLGSFSLDAPDGGTTSTYFSVGTTDIADLDLIVQPDLRSRPLYLRDRATGKPKPIWFGPEYKMHIDSLPWYDTTHDSKIPAEYRDMF